MTDIRHGIFLFNANEFFEAHEALEDVWRKAPAGDRKFLQGLIQVAVALHHHSKGNVVGARSLLARADRNLGQYPDSFSGIDLQRLRRSLAEWRSALEEGKAVPPLPKL